MVVLATFGSVAQACSPSTEEWVLPADGDEEVPTNALLYAAGWFSRMQLRRADDDTPVATQREETAGWYVDDVRLADIRRPVDELEPDTEYVITWDDQAVASFVTGSGPTDAPPEVPDVLDVTHGRSFSFGPCREVGFVFVSLAGDGPLLLSDDGTEPAEVHSAAPFLASVGVDLMDGTWARERRDVGRRVRFGIVDQSGGWSGWSEDVVTGCGCAAGSSGGAGPAALATAALSVIARSRRRSRGTIR